MNFGDINPAMPQPQPINECLRVQSTMDPAHSIGKPGVSPTTTNIDVRFAPFSTDEIKIKKRSMKKLSTLSRTPFTDLMLHPDKLEAVLKSYQRKNSLGATPRRAARDSSKPGPTRSWDQQP